MTTYFEFKTMTLSLFCQYHILLKKLLKMHCKVRQSNWYCIDSQYHFVLFESDHDLNE